MLEQASADANDKTVHGLPLLVHAIASGQEQLANLLVQHGASVDAVDGGSPPLLLACQAGSLKLTLSLSLTLTRNLTLPLALALT